MAAPFSQYDPLGVLMTFSGPGFRILFTGFMDGTFIEGQRDEDAFSKKTGATGDVARVKNRNRGGSIKVVLMQTSPTNAQLSALHTLGESIPLTIADVGQIQVKSLTDITRLHATHAWIKKVAAAPYAKELSGREWTFDCETLDMDIGDAF